MYKVYILKCSDGSFYTGITTDIDRRLKEHNGELPGGAKYTKARGPVLLIYSEDLGDRSRATKREIQIKKMTKKQKIELIENQGKNYMKS